VIPNRCSRTIVALSLLLAATGAAMSAQSTQTATQYYLAYRVVFDKATSVDDLKPYHSKAVQAKMDATSREDAAMMFEMVKMMGTVTNLKVVKETKTDTGATLSVEALDPEKQKVTGEVTLVREGGAWKLERERWKSS
jgi:hypothetical protein